VAARTTRRRRTGARKPGTNDALALVTVSGEGALGHDDVDDASTTDASEWGRPRRGLLAENDVGLARGLDWRRRGVSSVIGSCDLPALIGAGEFRLGHVGSIRVLLASLLV
jgi:hypothetical protein